MSEKSAFYRTCDKLSLWALSLFALECVLGCSGRWLNFGSFSIRMVLFAVCFLFTLPNLFCQLRTLIRSSHIILTLLFGFYLVLAAFMGWQRQNNISFVVADITGFLTLALMPGFLATVCTPKRIHRLTDVIFWGSLILGIVTTAVHICFAFIPDTQINMLNGWLNNHHMGGFANLQTGMQRIYLRSQIFLQVGLLLGLRKCWCASGWRRWLFFVAEGVILFGCLMSLTRGFWIGFAVSAILLLLLRPQYWKEYLVTVGAVALVIAGLFSLSWLSYGQPVAAREIVSRFNPALISGTILSPDFTDPSSPDSTDPSLNPTDPSSSDPSEPDSSGTTNADQSAVEIRQKTLQQLKTLIRSHPIFGNGLGTNLDGVRDDGKTEYMYQDVLMKLGIVGFLLFLLVFFLPSLLLLIQAVQHLIARKAILWDSPEMHNTILATAFIGVALTSYVNPYLTNPMGILLVLLTTAALRQVNKQIA